MPTIVAAHRQKIRAAYVNARCSARYLSDVLSVDSAMLPETRKAIQEAEKDCARMAERLLHLMGDADKTALRGV